MKKFVALAITTTAVLMSQNTYAQQNPTEKLAADAAISCMVKNAPANWDSLVAWIDRSNPKILAVSALSHVAGSTQNAPLELCDIKTHAELMGGFIPMIPASQASWKALFIRVDNKGQYQVFSDIALAASLKK